MQLHFVVAGFSKCGTTSLCSMLMAHPQLYIPPRRKEPRFFSNDEYPILWNGYQNLFYAAPADALLGEGSVSYTEHEFARISIKRILRYFPKIKVIIIARDPIDRIESSYREMHNSGLDWGVNCPFDIFEAIRKKRNIIMDSKYAEVLSIYHEYFPKERLLVLFQEDLRRQPAIEIQKCFQFLGVKDLPYEAVKTNELNQGAGKFHDTEAFRKLWSTRLEGQASTAIYSIPTGILNQLLPAYDLRKPFGKTKIEWPREAKELVVRKLYRDPFTFLAQNGKDQSFWPRYKAFFEEIEE